MCLSQALLFLNNSFQIKAAKRKSAFIQSTTFESLFSVHFQVSTLNESDHLLVKRPCDSVCYNLNVIQVCTFHDWCKQGIDQQIFNRKSISPKITHLQSWKLQAKLKENCKQSL